SSLSGVTDVTFDGLGLTTALTNPVSQVAFFMGGSNTYSGTTTVKGGGRLILDYGTLAAPQANSKLDDSSAFVFRGGSLAVEGTSGIYTEVVASTTVDSGANAITIGPGNVGSTLTYAAGALSHHT